MKYAAFFRNLNLGHPNSPSRQQLESAFSTAGAEHVSSFQTNGSVVFSVARLALARSVTRQACANLNALCGMTEPAFVRSVRQLAKLVASDPFAEFATAGSDERYVSFLAPQALTSAASVTPPIASGRDDVLVFRFADGAALSVTRSINGRVGSPTALLEKLLQVPVTTRSWNTIVRLVERHT